MEAGYAGGAESDSGTVKWWKQRWLGGDIAKKAKEIQNQALKRAYEELKKCMAKRISFPQ